MYRLLLSLCVLLSFLLSACQTGNVHESSTFSPERLLTQVPPTATITAYPTATATQNHTETSTPTNTPTVTPNPTSTPSPETTPPALLYIQDSQLYEQSGDESIEIANLPDAGSVAAAFRSGNNVIILREQGLQRLRMGDGQTDMIFRFDKPVLWGIMIASGDGSKTVFSAVLDDPKAEFSFSTVVGLYDVNLDSVQPLLSVPLTLKVLGFSQDNLSLYLLPVGQDPEFGKILLFGVEMAEIAKEIPLRGNLYASLAPDSRYLATKAGPFGDLERTIYVYDLSSSPVTPPRTYPFPNEPSHIRGVEWSPDSQSLYTMLLSGPSWDIPAESYGLWRIDIGSGEIYRVSNVTETEFFPALISPDGGWILLRHETENEALWVNLSSGEQKPIVIPADAILVNGP